MKWPFVALSVFLASIAGCSDPGGTSDGAADASGAPDATADLDSRSPSDAWSGADGGGADGATDAQATPCELDGGDADGGLPDELACTGLYSNWGKRTLAPDVNYYDPGFKLWSDGAVKRRWIWLPPQTHIDTTDMDEWTFPVGTKIWKEFALGGQVGSGGTLTGGKVVETRLIWKESQTSWVSAVYLWSDDQSSAHRITSGAMVPQADGPPAYEVPAAGTCPSCHAGRKDFVLGFDWIGLGVPSAGGTGGLTLSTLPKGWLTEAPPATTITIPEDATKKAAPALGLLHMNCGVTCHNTGHGKAGYTGLYLKLLVAQVYPKTGTATVSHLDAYTTAVNVKGHLAFGKYMRIAPGSSAESLLPLMALARDPDAGVFLQMPPLLSHRADTNPATGIPLVQSWINAL